ncbi:MAG: response regulator [Mariprofundaceae bacterium]|nr:response regulator [Mariprofundaceae bacterium]
MLLNVLLVEDEENVQHIIGAFLKRFGDVHGVDIHITALYDPVQGLFEATTNGDHYDMILLDVRLPKLTGDEIYKSITHVNPQLLDRVLFVTGYREDLEGRFPGQKLRVLDKPFRYQQLEEQIQAIVH